jgi:ubiquinone/menaquinone biosynthesis C-methylase UbiE
MASKTKQVKSLFEKPDKYFSRRESDIRIRTETVQHFTNSMMFDNVLDIGCGNGAISLPLLPRCRRLTLLDLSSKMLELARQQIPLERTRDVHMINGDFIGANLARSSFDLILCIGVLAHVDSPAAVIAKVSGLAKPGSWVVLEFTDSFHFSGVPNVIYLELLNLLRPEPYGLNRLRRRQVMGWCSENGLRPCALYRYAFPLPGTSIIVGQQELYRWTRYMFGPSDRNRNGWMGNEFLCFLQKT